MQSDFLAKSNLHKELTCFERKRWEKLRLHAKNGGQWLTGARWAEKGENGLRENSIIDVIKITRGFEREEKMGRKAWGGNNCKGK